MIVEPPLLAGAAKDTIALWKPAVLVSIVGASGTVAGTTLFDAADAELVPTPLVAVTVQV